MRLFSDYVTQSPKHSKEETYEHSNSIPCDFLELMKHLITTVSG